MKNVNFDAYEFLGIYDTDEAKTFYSLLASGKIEEAGKMVEFDLTDTTHAILDELHPPFLRVGDDEANDSFGQYDLLQPLGEEEPYFDFIKIVGGKVGSESTTHDYLKKTVLEFEKRLNGIAVKECNGDALTPAEQFTAEEFKAWFALFFGVKFEAVGYINGDPRGYTLKLKDNEQNLPFEKDWGGYYLLSKPKYTRQPVTNAGPVFLAMEEGVKDEICALMLLADCDQYDAQSKLDGNDWLCFDDYNDAEKAAVEAAKQTFEDCYSVEGIGFLKNYIDYDRAATDSIDSYGAAFYLAGYDSEERQIDFNGQSFWFYRNN